MHHRVPSLVAGLPLLCLCGTISMAQVVSAPTVPQIGSSNPASPEPPITRPSSTPCTVPLLTEQAFADFSQKPISFSPPANCKGPWAKVVFSADFTVTAGRQYDRTAKFFLGGANIFFGTTAEPRATLSPSWHVERDVTDLSSLFHTKQIGQATLGNFVGVSGGVTYDGIIYANARLQFYPANAANPAPEVPTAVIGFPNNDSHFVNTTTDVSADARVYPKNLERLYLDVIPQSQSTDEFWYLNVPSNLSAQLEEYGNTGFRETEVTVDGKPAGVVPVYPWIYTGGIDPYLWEPIPGVETLNLQPYRVDLSPFVGTLTDGKPHTVAVSVFNANTGFDVASTLLLYTGPSGSVTTGALLRDTLAAQPSPVVQTSLNTAADGTVSGPVSVTSKRAWTIAGYINTSHGRIDTTIEATNSFSNLQDEKVSATTLKQNLRQQTDQTELVTVRTNTGTTATQHIISYPLSVSYNQARNAQGNNDITTSVKQGRYTALRSPQGPNSPNPVVTNEIVDTTDTLHYNADFSASLGHDGDAATATYSSKDAEQRCRYRHLASQGVVLTQEDDNDSCSFAP